MKTVLSIGGMTCASCVSHVTQALRGVDGVADASVNLATERASIVHDAHVSTEALVTAVQRAGYEAQPPLRDDVEQSRRVADLRVKRHLLAIGAVLCAPTVVLAMFAPEFSGKTWLLFALTLAVWLVVGWHFHRSALASLRQGTATMDTLVSLGSTAALFLSGYNMVAGKPTYFETASAIVVLVFAGKYLEASARVNGNAALRTLLDLRPARARRRRADGSVETVGVDEVHPGDTLLIAAGERIPVDGIVTAGESALDRSMLTGESMPVETHAGNDVAAGTVNGDGALEIRATAVGEATELARIIDIVRRAQGSTPPVQLLADRISSIFVPSILVVSLLTLSGWLMFHHTWTQAVIAAIAVLVVACPCALGLATPTAIIAGVGAGARAGLLFKDAGALERASRITTVVFDKTGTLTNGKPRVTSVHSIAGDGDGVVRMAAALESQSTHPIARAVSAFAQERAIAVPAALDVRVTRGAGISGTVDGERVLAGNAAFLEADGIATGDSDLGASTRVFVAGNGTLAGWIEVADTLRDDAADTVAQLHRAGIETLLVSGDAPEPTAEVARQAGIAVWHAHASPEEKSQIVEQMRADGKVVAFVGDGINDAPALAVADVGFALGSGTAVAMETASATILSNDPGAVVAAIHLARATLRTIQQNLFWAFAYNVVLVPLAALGIVTPMFAAAAMGLSSLFVVGNSLLLARR